MKKDEYGVLIERAKKETTAKGQRESIIDILEIMCANHLPTIEARISKYARWGTAFFFVILLAILVTNHEALVLIFQALFRVL